jgi:hypothetical protein
MQMEQQQMLMQVPLRMLLQQLLVLALNQYLTVSEALTQAWLLVPLLFRRLGVRQCVVEVVAPTVFPPRSFLSTHLQCHPAFGRFNVRAAFVVKEARAWSRDKPKHRR